MVHGGSNPPFRTSSLPVVVCDHSLNRKLRGTNRDEHPVNRGAIW